MIQMGGFFIQGLCAMLFNIKKILVCTDLSESSENVLIQSEVLRKRLSCEMDVLYVSEIGLQLDWAFEGTTRVSYHDVFIKKIRTELEVKLNDQILKTSVAARPLIHEGSPSVVINDLIINGDTKYDLLILGHSGHKGLFHHYLGSVARKIVSNTPLPVLIIKRNLQFSLISCFLDGSRPIDWMVATGFDYFRILKFQKIEFVSLWMDYPEPFHKEIIASDFSQTLDEEIKYITRPNEVYQIRVDPVRELPIAKQLARIIDEDKIDLAVVKRNRGKKINKKFLGSETQRLLEMDTCNILVMPI
jgi:nucleotide-binding universal stress UspA family protein